MKLNRVPGELLHEILPAPGPMSDYILVGFVAIVAAAIHRAALLWIYRSWFRQGFAADAAFHLAVVKRIKQTGGYDGVPEFLIREEADSYPKLFHRIVARFPLDVIRKYPYLPNAVIWVFATLMCALYAQYVSENLFGYSGYQFSLVFLLLFLGLASNLSLDMNGLNYISLSERLLSRVCCGLYFATLVMALAYHDEISLILSAVFGTMTLVSSMFGRQAIFFITPLVCVFSISTIPFLALAASILGATIIDGRYFWRGLKHMRQFSHAYRNHTKHSRYYKLGLSRFVSLRTVFSRGVGFRWRIHEVENNEPTRLAFRHPDVLLIIILACLWPKYAAWPEISVVAATLVVYVATSTAALRHYGEASRYVEFSLFVLPALLLTKYAIHAPVPAAVWLTYGAWVALATASRVYAWSALKFPDVDLLKSFISPLGLNAGSTLYTVPFTLGAAISVRTGSRALMYQGSAVTLSLYEKFMEEIPFLKREWKELSHQYGVSHIICERSYLDLTKPLLGWEYDFSGAQKVAENDRYVAYRLK